MENFKRINRNSNLEIVNSEQLLIFEDNATLILQIVPLSEKLYICEYISRLEEDNVPKSLPSNTMPRGDIDFENYLDTTINKDTFGAVWSGATIREVFEAGDEAWIKKALKEMKNEFIRSKIEYIIKRGGYGKVKN